MKILLTSFFLLLLIGCQQKPTETLEMASDDTAVEHAQKHADPNYVCPMHPQIVRGEPGNCPICGMDLVKRDPPKEKKILYWVAPMDANYRRDEPGKSPMGMDLVPVYDDGSSGAEEGDFPVITVDAAVRQNLGLRTVKVQRETLWKYIKTVGRIEYDEDKLQHVHPRAEGWVEKLMVRSVGSWVKKDDVLLEYYSPEILAAEEEYLVALKIRNGLAKIAADRLRLLGVPESTIKAIRKSRKVQRAVPLLAPDDGVVTKMGLREGMFIKPAMELFTLGELNEIWVQVDVFEDQIDWVEIGRPAEIRIEALPGRKWEGEIEYIYPELDAKTRTLKVRLRFANPKGELKPNMFADVIIFGGPKKDVLSIPREAIIPANETARVVKKVEEGKFQPVVIVPGLRSGDRVEVLSGLEVGDEIVVSGQFMIDSESNLQASFRRMGAGE